MCVFYLWAFQPQVCVIVCCRSFMGVFRKTQDILEVRVSQKKYLISDWTNLKNKNYFINL